MHNDSRILQEESKWKKKNLFVWWNRKHLVVECLMAQMIKNLPPVWDSWLWSLGGEDPLKKGTATRCNILAGKSQGQRSLGGYSPQGCKESDRWSDLTLSHVHKGECWRLPRSGWSPARSVKPFLPAQIIIFFSFNYIYLVNVSFSHPIMHNLVKLFQVFNLVKLIQLLNKPSFLRDRYSVLSFFLSYY